MASDLKVKPQPESPAAGHRLEQHEAVTLAVLRIHINDIQRNESRTEEEAVLAAAREFRICLRRKA